MHSKKSIIFLYFTSTNFPLRFSNFWAFSRLDVYMPFLNLAQGDKMAQKMIVRENQSTQIFLMPIHAKLNQSENISAQSNILVSNLTF